MRHRYLKAGAIAVACTLTSGISIADDVANMLVTANVAPSCQLNSVPTIAFGTLDPLIDNNTQGDIIWVCTSGTSTVIQLNGGGSGNILARTMTGTPGALPYQLYTDASRSQIFGDGTTGNDVGVSGTGYATPDTVTVYGRVAQADAESATNGNYSDTVVVTIVF